MKDQASTTGSQLHRGRRSHTWSTRLLPASAAVWIVMLLSACMPSPATTASAATVSPSATVALAATSCHPAAALPWKCDTFRSTFGDKAVAGTTGGPKQDPLQMSLTTSGGRLLLHARAADCLAAVVPMRVVTLSTNPVQRGLDRAGGARFSGYRCSAPPAGSWAHQFLSGSLRSQYGTFFGRGTQTVIFEYQGAAPIGQAQPFPRNDLTCRSAHVQPFSCGRYHAIGGTGRLQFLATRPFTLVFEHNNAELEATLKGRCNALEASLALDGSHAVVTGGASTAMGCFGQRQSDDLAVSDFFTGDLTYAIHGATLTFSSPTGSATFDK